MRNMTVNVAILRTGEKQTSKVPFKGSLSGLRNFLATESSLKMMKNDFYVLCHLKSSFFRSADI